MVDEWEKVELFPRPELWGNRSHLAQNRKLDWAHIDDSTLPLAKKPVM